MEKKMETIIMCYIRTTTRIHSFIPSEPKASSSHGMSVRHSAGCILPAHLYVPGSAFSKTSILFLPFPNGYARLQLWVLDAGQPRHLDSYLPAQEWCFELKVS